MSHRRFDDGHSDRCEVAPHCRIDLRSLMASDQERLEGGSAFGPPAGSGGHGSSWLLPILLVLGPPGCERLGVHLGPKRL